MIDLRAFAVLSAVALLAIGCTEDAAPSASPGADRTSSSSSVSTAATPTPPPTATEAPVPSRGACHRLSFEDALSPTAGIGDISCKKPHTAETYATGQVANLAEGHLLAIDSAQVQQQVATSCPDALPRAVGGSLAAVRLSMLRAVWFTPTVEESDEGADWYRCDVVALAGAERLTKVRGSLAGILSTPPGRETYAMCGTTGPDEEDFKRVPCADPHSWRAFSVIALPAGTYPGRAAVASAGQSCQDAAARVADDALDYEWGFEGPDGDQWGAGQTFIRCWTPG